MATQKKKPGRPAGSGSKSTGSRSTGSKSTNRASQTKEAKSAATAAAAQRSKVRDDIWAVIIMAIGVFLVVSLQTKAAGTVGIIISNLFKGWFGATAFILPYYLIIYGVLLLIKKVKHINGQSILFMTIIFLMISMINSGRFLDPENILITPDKFAGLFDAGVALSGGGFIGMILGGVMVKLIGKMGLYILSLVVIMICGMLIANTPITRLLEQWRERREFIREDRVAADELEEERKQSAVEARSAGGSVYNSKRTSGIMPDMAAIKIRKGRKKILEYVCEDEIFGMNEVAEEISFDGKVINQDEEKIAAKAVDEGIVSHKEEEIKVDVYGLEPDYEYNASKKKAGEIMIEAADTGTIDAGVFETVNSQKAFDAVTLSSSTNRVSVPEEIPNSITQGISDKLTEEDVMDSGITVSTYKTNEASQEPVNSTQAQGESQIALDIPKEVAAMIYKLPPVELLNKGPKNEDPKMDMNLRAKAIKLEQTLQNFNVNAKVSQVTQGPTVTRYEIQPSTGVKVSSIVRLADDIALNLEAKSIRMEAPIPGKAAVGIEVENDKINLVAVRDIIDTKEFRNAKSKITFAVGKDISGNAIVADLKGMPHMLIAGSTGSGKSVCINSIIISILYKSKPNEVKFVLIDPKVVELGNYNGIPHLLIPVVTEPSKAAAALNWAVAEMTDRYKKFAAIGVRDLQSYNDKIKEKAEGDEALPQIVIIIDELADLMMAAPSQVEESICRLAQMARAAGMHLIVATQRPSVDIITGVIKANIPSRIAFAVSSQFDSRTILDMAGAEKLVGKGDMLFNPLGMGKPLRVQGNFISDSEVHKVIEFWKSQVPNVEYAGDVIRTIEKAGSSDVSNDGDELLAEVIETVVRAEQASVSMLQRRFRIGYNRAARIIDMMEDRGIIGPADGSRPRQVLMTVDELIEMQNDTEDLE